MMPRDDGVLPSREDRGSRKCVSFGARLLVDIGALLFSLAACSRERPTQVVAPPSDSLWTSTQYFWDKFGGTTWTLTAKSNELVVVFDPETSASQRQLVAEEYSLVPICGHIGMEIPYWAFHVGSGMAVKDVGPKVVRSPFVCCGLPAYVDQEGWSWYVHPYRIVIVFDDASVEQSEALIAAWGGVVVRRAETPGMYTIRFRDQRTVFEHVKELAAKSEVAVVQMDKWYSCDGPL